MPLTVNNAPPITAKVAYLSRPDAYPDATHHVQVVETHMSWVFLTDAHAYKLKKPVRYDFLDFSTLDARLRDCEEEVRLNRRLAADVYLGIVALTASDGVMQLGGAGEIADWLVKMRRLPAAHMLDNAIKSHTLDMGQVRAMAATLARFYRDAPPIAITGPEYRARLTRQIRDNLIELTRPGYSLDARLVRRLGEAQFAILRDAPWLFDERVRAGRVIEAHGDLRPEHICLGAHPVVIDCLEFRREFRELDTADELAFLAMECEYLGARQVGDEVYNVYRQRCGDAPDEMLVAFYQCYRACLRAKIAAWHTKDGAVHDHDGWFQRARRYLRLAARYARALKSPL